jgi:imidazolonepropionase-like amidohydrolase
MVHHKASMAFAVTVALIAGVSAAPQTRKLAINTVNVIDVASGRILPNATVVVDGDTIASVTQTGAPSAGVRVVDGRGQFLIPGLWDMHAHMQASGTPWLQLYVANGVTAIRDMGSDLDVISNMRAATASGRTLGPRIFAAGPILDDAPGDWPYRMRVKTAADGRAAVGLLKRRGVDLIKVHDHTPHDAFFAIAGEAARHHLPLAGHVPLGLTVEAVIDAGQRDIEHLNNLSLWKPCSRGPEYKPDGCRPVWEMMARQNVWSGPTLVAMAEIATIGTAASHVSADRLVYATASIRAMWAGNQGASNAAAIARALRQGADIGAVVTRDMAAAGVGILAGCDTMIAGFCVHDELAAMVRGGMTPLAALQSATLNPARYFDIQRTTGRIERGMRADLVLLDANPLVDIGNVGRIRAVVVAGRFLDRAELDKTLAQVKVAASQP